MGKGGSGAAASGAVGGGDAPQPGDKTNADALVSLVLDSGALPGGKRFQNPASSLYVGGLPSNTSLGHMYKLFSPFGAIASAHKKGGDSGAYDGRVIGFVNFLE